MSWKKKERHNGEGKDNRSSDLTETGRGRTAAGHSIPDATNKSTEDELGKGFMVYKDRFRETRSVLETDNGREDPCCERTLTDLDSPSGSQVTTVQEGDVTYIKVNPDPLSMLEVIDNSETTTSATNSSVLNGNGANGKTNRDGGTMATACDQENVLMVNVEPESVSLLEIGTPGSGSSGLNGVTSAAEALAMIPYHAHPHYQMHVQQQIQQMAPHHQQLHHHLHNHHAPAISSPNAVNHVHGAGGASAQTVPMGNHTSHHNQQPCAGVSSMRHHGNPDLNQDGGAIRPSVDHPSWMMSLDDSNATTNTSAHHNTVTELQAPRTYTCTACGESYPLLEQLKTHMATHLVNVKHPYIAKYFDTTVYDGPDSYGNRTTTTTSSAMPIECAVCSETFPKVSAYKRHMVKHNSEKPFVCKECGKSYAELAYLKRHILSHNESNLCSICNEKFDDVNALREHIQNHASTGAKPHSCMVCGKLYTRLTILKRHIMMHFDETSPYCSDKIEDILDGNFNVKVKRRSGSSNNRRHVCATCNKAFNSLGNLHRHYRVHTGEKPYTCETCNASFSQISHLRQHYQVHSDEKHVCPVCSVTISNDRNFKRHIKLHTGDRPFKCTSCVASFTQQSHLKKHARVHEVDFYTCQQCNVRFPDLRQYKEHVRTHAGANPYACSLCDEKYAEIDDLKRHVDNHHGLREKNNQLLGGRSTGTSSVTNNKLNNGSSSSVNGTSASQPVKSLGVVNGVKKPKVPMSDAATQSEPSELVSKNNSSNAV